MPKHAQGLRSIFCEADEILNVFSLGVKFFRTLRFAFCEIITISILDFIISISDSAYDRIHGIVAQKSGFIV